MADAVAAAALAGGDINRHWIMARRCRNISSFVRRHLYNLIAITVLRRQRERVTRVM